MKIYDFDDFICILKDQTPDSGKSPLPAPPPAPPQASPLPRPPEKAVPLASPKANLQEEAENFALPDSFLKAAGVKGDMELEIMDNVMVLTNRNMTVTELLNALESLERKTRDFYRCLVENFMDDVSEAGCDCDFCNICMNTNGSFPEFLKAMGESKGNHEGVLADLGDVSEEMVERLHDMGLCLSEINLAIMEEEVIYYGAP